MPLFIKRVTVPDSYLCKSLDSLALNSKRLNLCKEVLMNSVSQSRDVVPFLKSEGSTFKDLKEIKIEIFLLFSARTSVEFKEL